MITLRGRLCAAAPDTLSEPYGLLLCTHCPRFVKKLGKHEPNGMVPDDSAHTLLSKYPPHMVPAASEPDMAVSLKLPYDLLRDMEKAKDDFAKCQLGRCSDAPVSEGGDGSVCNAHITIPTRGKQNTAARIRFWQEELAKYAGQWVQVIVEPRRYSFAADISDAKGEPARVQRVGTKLMLMSVKPVAGSI